MEEKWRIMNVVSKKMAVSEYTSFYLFVNYEKNILLVIYLFVYSSLLYKLVPLSTKHLWNSLYENISNIFKKKSLMYLQ